MEGYITVAGPAEAELVEKRSRFLAEIRPVDGEAAFAEFLAEKRAQHYSARHHCWAYLLQGGGVQRYSDDGEPQGTAGVPILEVIRREGLEDCAVIVTRYFGGTLLGAGGLVRAYTASAKLAIDGAKRVEICRCVDFSLASPYPLYDRVGLLLEECSAQVLDTAFADQVTLRARMRAKDLEGFSARLTELSSGTVAPDNLEETLAQLENRK